MSSQGQVVAYARMLDYETVPVHTLTIEAVDGASPANLQRFSTAVVSYCQLPVLDCELLFSLHFS